MCVYMCTSLSLSIYIYIYVYIYIYIYTCIYINIYAYAVLTVLGPHKPTPSPTSLFNQYNLGCIK